MIPSEESLCKVRAHKHVSHDCQNGHIFGLVTFLMFLHNVTLFGMDNTKKCLIMQKHQKSHQSKAMTILTIFCHTC